MLPPPCIRWFIECDGNEVFESSDPYTEQYSDFSLTTGLAGSGNTLSSQNSGTMSTLPLRSGLERFQIPVYSMRSAKELGAFYTVSLQNNGDQNLSGVKIMHGPLPFGVTFDQASSASGCINSGTSVQCILNLRPNESKEITLAYTVMNPVHCRIAPVLQTVQTEVLGNTQGSNQNLVTASIDCITEDKGLGSSTGSSVDMDEPFHNPFANTLSSVATSNRQETTTHLAAVLIPRTKTDSNLTNEVQQNFTSQSENSPVFGMSWASILWLSVAIFVFFSVIIIRKLRQS